MEFAALPFSIVGKQQVFLFEQFAQIANCLDGFILARHHLETMPNLAPRGRSTECHRVADSIGSFALAAHVPTLFDSSEYVEAGGLMSYGANFADLYRRTADFADKILRGAKPAEMPVEQPTKFDLAVNLTTAEVLGLSLPTTFLARADEVIE